MYMEMETDTDTNRDMGMDMTWKGTLSLSDFVKSKLSESNGNYELNISAINDKRESKLSGVDNGGESTLSVLFNTDSSNSPHCLQRRVIILITYLQNP